MAGLVHLTSFIVVSCETHRCARGIMPAGNVGHSMSEHPILHPTRPAA